MSSVVLHVVYQCSAYVATMDPLNIPSKKPGRNQPGFTLTVLLQQVHHECDLRTKKIVVCRRLDYDVGTTNHRLAHILSEQTPSVRPPSPKQLASS